MRKFSTNPDAFDSDIENKAIVIKKKCKRGRPPLSQNQLKSETRYFEERKPVEPFSQLDNSMNKIILPTQNKEISLVR